MKGLLPVTPGFRSLRMALLKGVPSGGRYSLPSCAFAAILARGDSAPDPLPSRQALLS